MPVSLRSLSQSSPFSLCARSGVLWVMVCALCCIVFRFECRACLPWWCWLRRCPSCSSLVCVCSCVRMCLVFRLSFQRFFFSFFLFVRFFSVRNFAVLGVNSTPYRVISTGILKLALGSYPIAGSQVFPFLEEVRMGGGKRGNGLVIGFLSYALVIIYLFILFLFPGKWSPYIQPLRPGVPKNNVVSIPKSCSSA